MKCICIKSFLNENGISYNLSVFTSCILREAILLVKEEGPLEDFI
ncbi:hypothetical protein pah_c016o156 [Parachlamydia acanthamoebae str. Hall's coccus]|nr:hypothetical protein pah_c016o156 [Parachlamydia acanthamoebae str. Hall's coccus]